MTVDTEQLAEDLALIRKDLQADMGADDFKHLRKIEGWGRACTLLGYATAWIAPNPFSALLISQGIFTRWTTIAHPISHRGYDRIDGIPEHYTSKGFAKGWRRILDWFDWMHPEAWHEEHDNLHHYNLGETVDPDQLEYNMEWLRNSRAPMALRYLFLALFACVWKPTYYGPNTLKELRGATARRKGQPAPPSLLSVEAWSPFTSMGREVWLKSLLPYAAFRFAFLPALFLPFGKSAAIAVLINSVLAEILTNLHAFLVIVPNHAGDDIPRFDEGVSARSEFYLRQIVGSVNYPCGNDRVDFFHGWLNYQIEHHIWPDLPLLQYQRSQARVKECCEKHGVPYVQDSVFKRLVKAVQIMAGATTMPENYTHGFEEEASDAAA
jgi:fatty acid desaturase